MWSQLLQDSKNNSKQVCGEHIEVAAVFTISQLACTVGTPIES